MTSLRLGSSTPGYMALAERAFTISRLVQTQVVINSTDGFSATEGWDPVCPALVDGFSF